MEIFWITNEKQKVCQKSDQIENINKEEGRGESEGEQKWSKSQQ